MKNLLQSSLGRFRIVAFLEGLSFILLVFIAMPLKYYYAHPEFIRPLGMAHGILFILFITTLIEATLKQKWSFLKAILAFGSSLLPFGTFVFDYTIKNEEIK